MSGSSLLSRPPVLRRFAIETLPREAWKNGGGWTRTVASREQQGRLRWRVSVADIGAAGPFSRFEGMDRTAVMVQGGALGLIGQHQAWRFDGPGSYAQFPGELDLQCEAPQQPTQLWNVMVQRGQAQADLLIADEDTVSLPSAPDLLALVLRGRFELALPGAEPLLLLPGEGLQLQDLATPGSLAARAAHSLLLHPVLR